MCASSPASGNFSQSKITFHHPYVVRCRSFIPLSFSLFPLHSSSFLHAKNIHVKERTTWNAKTQEDFLATTEKSSAISRTDFLRHRSEPRSILKIYFFLFSLPPTGFVRLYVHCLDRLAMKAFGKFIRMPRTIPLEIVIRV